MRPVEHTTGFTLTQGIKTVFPLFTPEGEKLWSPGWDYENVMGTADIAEDSVFLTGTHDHASSHAIWIVKSYEPDQGLVAYYRVEPGDKVGIVSVCCTPIESGSTHVEVTYRYIPISETGAAFVAGYTRQKHADFIAGWQSLLEHYFESCGGEEHDA